MQTKTEDVYVTKLVGFVTRIPKHKNLDSFIHGLKQGLLKTIARVFLWS